MLSLVRFALMLMWYPSNNGYIAFCGINVIVLPSKPGHLSTISLSKTAISANFINVSTSLLLITVSNKKLLVRFHFLFTAFLSWVGRWDLNPHQSGNITRIVFPFFELAQKQCPKSSGSGRGDVVSVFCGCLPSEPILLFLSYFLAFAIQFSPEREDMALQKFLGHSTISVIEISETINS